MFESKDLEIFKSELINNLNNSYSPYTKYRVSALLFTEKGVFRGVNIEDGIQSICAERSAFVSAISSGDKSFKKLFIVAKDDEKEGFDDDVIPCGHCLQFISEFVDESFPIFVFGNSEIKVYTLKELLPYNFKR